jgi:4-amino-4-deoxy-L-arabinose transferase-like glycosyltransferase
VARRFDALLALALGGGYVALLLGTAADLGYARDEGFYFAAAASYERWFSLLFEQGRAALEPAVIDRYWSANHEHPALMKSLFALSHRYLYTAWHWFSEQGTAYRFPGMVVSALAVSVTYLWARAFVGRTAALVAAGLLAAMPRVFYHSHLACFDMPVAALWLVTTYAYARSLEQNRRGWALATGILFGLLLNTKHNAWLLPPALALHFVLLERSRLWRNLATGSVHVPLSLLAMIGLGPLIFYLSWPWIWHDTPRRLSEYVQFHLGHDYYNMEFLGRTYWKPPMPRLYAPLMTLATVPLVTLSLFLVGAALAAWQNWGDRLLRGQKRTPPADVEPSALAKSQLLWALCIVGSYAPWLSNETPIFGGTKHWLTAYPFICLFAGCAFQRALQELGTLLGRRAARLVPVLPAALATSVLLGPALITLHAHPWALSAYTPIVGGASGAATMGLNRTFWGYTTGSVQDDLNRSVPRGGKVFVHDTALQSWEMLVRDGRLRSDLRGSANVAGTDVALYHHEPHMSKVEFQIWIAYGTVSPARVATHDGVPVIWLYRR